MPICVEHLTHVYMPDTPFRATALNDVSFTIEDGEFVGLLGHTGSGKTTLVTHLNGLEKPTGGRVLVDGIDTAQKCASVNEIRRKVGLVFQYPEYQLFEETVAKDIAFGPKNLGLSEQEQQERVRTAMRRVGLSEEISERSPFELSGGQMRRVAIAGVLAMQPKVLILDEPSAGLDPAGRGAILDMVRSLHAAGDLTVIMVSHSMDDIAELATRLLVMDHGKLAMDGTPREVFQNQEQLTQIGLNVPQAAQLTHRLREAGIDLPQDLYTADEVYEALLALWRKEKGKC